MLNRKINYNKNIKYINSHNITVGDVMRIRLFNKKDLDEVISLFIDIFEKENKKEKWTKEMAEKYLLIHYRMNKDLCFVATENKKIIGIGLCMLKPEYSKYIIDSHILIVHPDYRRKKIATKLLKKLITKANNKYGASEIQSSVKSLTTFPISWYESIGFREKKHYSLVKAKIDDVLKSI